MRRRPFHYNVESSTPNGCLTDKWGMCVAGLLKINDWPIPEGGRRITLPVKAGACHWQEEALELTGQAPLLLELPAGEEDVLLELRELHQREDPVFAYSVEWEGNPLYFRDYEPFADAPSSVFIHLPRPVSGETVRLCIRPETGIIRFTGAALYSPSALNSPEEPMLLGFFTPRLTGGEEDDRTLAEIREAMASCRHLRPMVSFELAYMNRCDQEITATVTRWLRLCRKEGLPVFINLNTWWGGTPCGPDGRGGYFGDMEYQQVVYDPNTGERRLTVPNMWSNTPWYTMNNENLNHVRQQRLRRCVQLIRQAIAREGNETGPPVGLFLDNEPTYWAAFAYTDNADTGGDVSLSLLQAAQRDGVTFPEKGPWGDQQRQWLLDNLTAYIHELAAACLEETGKETVLVRDGEMLCADRMLAEHTYTHVFPFASYPYMDVRHPQWETHVTPAARLGLEGSTWDDPRILDYAIGFGHLANVNAERACYRDPSFHCLYYMYGADASIIFNYRPEDPIQMQQVDRLLEEMTAPDRDYPLPLLSLDVFRDGLEHPAVVRTERLAVRNYRQRRVLQPEEPGCGRLVLDAGEAERYGDVLTLELWAFVHPENGGIQVLLGSSPEKLEPVCQLTPHANEGDSFLTDLPLQSYRPDQRVYLGLAITSNTFETDWSLLNYIWRIRLMRRHSARAGHTDGFVFTAFQKRRLSRLVMERANYRRLQGACPSHLREVGSAQTAAGRYREACLLLKRAWKHQDSEYLLTDEGPLGDSGMYARTAQEIVLSLEQRKDSTTWLKAEGVPGTIFCVKGVTAQEKQDGWLLRPGKEATLLIPEKTDIMLEGRFRGLRGNCLRIQSQELERFHFQPYLDVPLAEEAQLLVRNEDESAFRSSCRQELPAGSLVQVKCRGGKIWQAWFTAGSCCGYVFDIQPLSFLPEARNGRLILDTKKGQRVFELGPDCRLAFSNAPAGRLLLCPGGDPGLQCGRRVHIHYCPYCTDGRPPRVLAIE